MDTDSQTKQTRYTRWENVENIFQLCDERALQHKHFLVVDDVITTGATAESCIGTLLEIQGVRVSFLAMSVNV